MKPIDRRQFLSTTAALAVAPLVRAEEQFRLNYILSSCMYGTLAIETIVPEVLKTGAGLLDIWPRVHGNQREQLEKMGHEKFTELLQRHKVRLGCITRYDLGPFGLKDEMLVAAKLGAKVLVGGGKGRRGSRAGN